MTSTKLLDRPGIQTPVRAVRRTRRAYLGALGMTYDFATARMERRRTQATALFAELVERGQSIEADAAVLLDRAKGEARDMFKTAEPITESALVSEDAPVTAKEVAAAPEGVSLDEMSDELRLHVERVQKYDPMANPAAVAKIVAHLGVALRSRDTRYVACSDEAERRTVAESWLSKKLGVSGDAAALDAKVMAVCEIMKADRLKDRVSFYYLAAKNAGKLGAL